MAAMHGQKEAVTGDAQHDLVYISSASCVMVADNVAMQTVSQSLSSMGLKRRCAPETVPFELMHARFHTPGGTHAWTRANAMTCPGITAHGLAERSGHCGMFFHVSNAPWWFP